MHEIGRRHIAALLTGHVGLIETPEGVQPLRMPAGDAHLHDQFSQFAAGMSSGVRLRMITDSIHLRLSVAQRQSYVTRPEEWPSVYDLWIDGKPHRRLSPVGGAYLGMSLAIEGDPAATLEIEDLPAGDKSIELWLPPTALVSIVSLEIDAGAHWKPWPDLQPSVVFHGSSITHGVGLDTATEAWPAIFARDLQASLLNLGWAGSCLISGLAGRMVRDQAASLIALELGINVHADGLLKERTFLSSVHSFIAIVREGHPTTPIAIVSPIFCEAAEDTALGDGLSLTSMRSLLAEAVETRRGAGDGRIQLISGLDLLGPADAADLPDGLHPSRNGHAKIASRFRTKAAALLNTSDLPPNSSYTDKLFVRACNIIKSHFCNPDIRPHDVAAEAGISLRYLQKLFTVRGTTCSHYIQTLRLDHAARLLHRRASMNAGQPLSEIGYACGFRDYTQFVRTFRRRFGCAPGRYEKSLKGYAVPEYRRNARSIPR